MFFFKSSTDCSAADVRAAIDDPNAIILDCRSHGEAASGVVRGAVVKDWLSGELHQSIGSMDKSKSYYLYCRSGNRSNQATQFMRSQGFDKVFNAGSVGALINL